MDGMAYLKTLGLSQHPFPVAPDDRHFYDCSYIEQIITELVHGIMARKGFMVLSGEVGVGKTTITRRILRFLAAQGVLTSLVFHTSLKDVDLLREINRDFGLTVNPASGCGLGDYLRQLNDFLLDQYGRGKNCTIIIDDAQNLDRASLELVRMISNLEAHRQKLVQILLVGQTELMTTLNSSSLRQMQSRIVIRKVVRSFSREESRGYIQFKLGATGGDDAIRLTWQAFRRLYGYTRGNCRRLNLLMDRCLYAICHQGRKIIDRQVVNLAYADLHPEKSRRNRVALAASMAVLGITVMASCVLHLHNGRSSMSTENLGLPRFKVPAAAAAVPEPAKTLIMPARKKTGPSIKAADSAVAAFLSIYQLDDYREDFQAALEAGHLEALALKIFSQTGYQLVQLATMPENIRRQYGALAFSVAADQPPAWLLFWRPRIELKRFYLDYRGEEIYPLQRLLAEVALYHQKLDGIVGPGLMRAVSAFQKASGLTVTGFPDAATLFLLCHQQEGSTLCPKA